MNCSSIWFNAPYRVRCDLIAQHYMNFDDYTELNNEIKYHKPTIFLSPGINLT